MCAATPLIGVFREGDSYTYYDSGTQTLIGAGTVGTVSNSSYTTTLYEQIAADGSCHIKTGTGIGFEFPGRIGCEAQKWPLFPSAPLTVGQILPPLSSQHLPVEPASCGVGVSNEQPKITFNGSILALNEQKITPAGTFITVKYSFEVTQSYSATPLFYGCSSNYVCWRDPTLDLTVACEAHHYSKFGGFEGSRVLTNLSRFGK
jgi:hypothetical protein